MDVTVENREIGLRTREMSISKGNTMSINVRVLKIPIMCA